MNIYNKITGIEDTIVSAIDYVAEPHQFSKDDLMEAVNYEDIKKCVEKVHNVVIDNMESFKEYVNNTVEWFASYDPMFFHI